MNFLNVKNKKDFDKYALKIFNLQASENKIYKQYLAYLNCKPSLVKNIKDIPFLPISFFKKYPILTGENAIQKTFLSSGTTGMKSKHHVVNLKIYEKSFQASFEYFYGKIKEWTMVALLPNYLEQKNASLVYMVENLIVKTQKKESGFYLYDLEKLAENLKILEQKKRKTLLIGVSFALLDLAEKFPMQLKNTIIMETGGMKGRKKELIRNVLHQKIKKGLGVSEVHSEYGMTELLSQAYSQKNGLFKTPPWMKILIRDLTDPFKIIGKNKIGGINIIDLANIHSCAFIATEDLGRKKEKDFFEILGRFDDSQIRGCNLLL